MHNRGTFFGAEEQASKIRGDKQRVLPGKSINRRTPVQEPGSYAVWDSTPWARRMRTGLIL